MKNSGGPKLEGGPDEGRRTEAGRPEQRSDGATDGGRSSGRAERRKNENDYEKENEAVDRRRTMREPKASRADFPESARAPNEGDEPAGGRVS